MKITKERIERVANLSKLYLDEKEVSDLEVHLNYILDQVDYLKQLDTEGEETVFVRDIQNVLREDETFQEFDREKMLSNAPLEEDGCFKVPLIVE